MNGLNYAIGIIDKFSGPLAKLDKGLQGVHKQLEQMQKQLDRVEQGAGKTAKTAKSGFDKMGDAAFRFNNILSTVGQGFGELDKVIQKSAALSDKMAIVQKNTGMSAKEMDKLKSQLEGIDTRTSLNELLDMSTSGGKLGIKDDLAGFVKAVDMANVALGDEFSSVSELTMVFGKITSQFKELQALGSEKALLKFGSALNYVGKQGANSAPNVADFIQRTNTTGINATKLLGYGAALEELGISAEIGSGGFKGIVNRMSVETKAFAKQVGMSQKAWKNLVNTDPNAAFMKFLESTQGYSNTDFASTLKNVKIGTQEASDVVKKLSGNMDRLKMRQIDAKTAFDLGNDIQGEFDLLNNTAGAELDKMKKKMDSVAVAVGGFIGPWGPLISTGGMAIMSFSSMLPLLGMLGKGLLWAGGKLMFAGAQALGFAGKLLTMGTAAVWAGIKGVAMLTYNVGMLLFKMPALIFYGVKSTIQFVRYGAAAKLAAARTWLVSNAQAAAGRVSMLFSVAQNGAGTALTVLRARLAAVSFSGMITGLMTSARMAIRASASYVLAAMQGLGPYILSLGSAVLAQMGFNAALTANPIGAVIMGITALVAAVWWLVENWDWVTEKAVQLWEFLKANNPFSGLIDGIREAFPELMTWIDKAWEYLTGMFNKVYEAGQETFGWLSESLGFGKTEFMETKQKELDKAKAAKEKEAWVKNAMDIYKIDRAGALEKWEKKQAGGGGGVTDTNTPTTNANVKNGLDSVAGGGSKPTNIYINFEAINQGGIQVTSNNLGAGLDEVERQVQDMFLRVVNSANQISE